MQDSEYMGNLFTCQLNGQTITVRVIAVEQTGKHRGKWVCRNLATSRRVWRTSRQLHKLHLDSIQQGRN